MKDIAVNKKASHDYEILETLEVGISLLGSEVKSIRNGNVSLKESFISVENNSLVWKQGFVKKYEINNAFSTIEETRERIILAKKIQVLKFKKQITLKGFTLIPLRLYLNDRNLIKMEIALARGKNVSDKRHSLKEKSQKRDMDRALKDS